MDKVAQLIRSVGHFCLLWLDTFQLIFLKVWNVSSNARLLIEPLAVDDTGTPSTRVRTNITAENNCSTS